MFQAKCTDDCFSIKLMSPVFIHNRRFYESEARPFTGHFGFKLEIAASFQRCENKVILSKFELYNERVKGDHLIGSIIESHNWLGKV